MFLYAWFTIPNYFFSWHNLPAPFPSLLACFPLQCLPPCSFMIAPNFGKKDLWETKKGLFWVCWRFEGDSSATNWGVLSRTLIYYSEERNFQKIISCISCLRCLVGIAKYTISKNYKSRNDQNVVILTEIIFYKNMSWNVLGYRGT